MSISFSTSVDLSIVSLSLSLSLFLSLSLPPPLSPEKKNPTKAKPYLLPIQVFSGDGEGGDELCSIVKHWGGCREVFGGANDFTINCKSCAFIAGVNRTRRLHQLNLNT